MKSCLRNEKTETTNPTRFATSDLRWRFVLSTVAVLVAVVGVVSCVGSSRVSAQQPTVAVSGDLESLFLEFDRLDRGHAPENLIEAPLVEGRPILGVAVSDSPLGVEVTSVLTGSAGDRAGFLKGDKIVELDEADIETPADVQLAIADHPLGKPMTIVAIRHNKRLVRRIQFIAPAEKQFAQDASSAPFIAKIERLERETRTLRRQVRLLRNAVSVLAEERAEKSDLPPPPASTRLLGERVAP